MTQTTPSPIHPDGAADRVETVRTLARIAEPVLDSLSRGKLKASLPVLRADRHAFAPLEALGRLLTGMAPWLELDAAGSENPPVAGSLSARGLASDEKDEPALRRRFVDLARAGIAGGVDPKSPDFMNFTQGQQPLVDAAFLAHALLRAPNLLWGGLPENARKDVDAALASSLHAIKAPDCNWLLFAATIAAARWKFAGELEIGFIEYAVKRHLEWYKGDGAYGDGAPFHWDYYNSFVIQPMLLDVLTVCGEKGHALGEHLPLILKRARRYAEVQERLISPEGTYPILGRSACYRVGAFQHLAQIALRRALPESTRPAAVRSALTAIIKRTFAAAGTFDKEGWLRPGALGYQPSITEPYISTGSLYLCAAGFVHLGLPETDAFWSLPGEPWTQKRAWAGEDLPADHAIHD